MKELNDFEIEEATGGKSVGVDGGHDCPPEHYCDLFNGKYGSKDKSCDNCRQYSGNNRCRL